MEQVQSAVTVLDLRRVIAMLSRGERAAAENTLYGAYPPVVTSPRRDTDFPDGPPAIGFLPHGISVAATVPARVSATIQNKGGEQGLLQSLGDETGRLDAVEERLVNLPRVAREGWVRLQATDRLGHALGGSHPLPSHRGAQVG